MQWVDISADGRCAVAASDRLCVLACSLPAEHDEGFRKSRELARGFCDAAEDAAARLRLGTEKLAELADALLRSNEWSGWHFSFCVVERREGSLRAFGCGLCGVAVKSKNQRAQLVLAPQTLRRKLGRAGGVEVPPYAEHIGVTMARAGMPASDIGTVEWPLADGMIVVGTAEPRLSDRLTELDVSVASVDGLRDEIDSILGSMNNPEPGFFLWSPA